MNDGIPQLAERLDLLFRTVPRQAGSPQLHTNESMASVLAEQGISVTANHLSNLRTGRRDNPSARLLAGLAEAFDVPYNYFFEDQVADEIGASLRTLVALRDSGVQKVMLRAQGVSPANLEAVLTVLDEIRKIEGLDAAAEGGS